MATVLKADQIGLLREDAVVVVLLWHLGDVLNVTSLLPSLSQKHHCKITFATSRSCVELLVDHPCIENVVSFDLELPGALSLKDFHRTAAISESTFKEVATVYNLHVPFDLSVTKCHIVECWAQLLGLSVDLGSLTPIYAPHAHVEQKVNYKKYFVLGNGGATKLKNWPLEKYAQFIRLMRRSFPDTHLIQLGSMKDPRIEGVEDRRGKTSLAETYTLLKSSRGCLTNDSFLAHLSAVAGCRTYVAYGSTSAVHFRPIGKAECVAFGERLFCSPCYRTRCLLSLGLTSCLAFPSAGEVFARVMQDLEASK
jgi:ADP-heptose:LPS heptosyltransferase